MFLYLIGIWYFCGIQLSRRAWLELVQGGQSVKMTCPNTRHARFSGIFSPRHTWQYHTSIFSLFESSIMTSTNYGGTFSC